MSDFAGMLRDLHADISNTTDPPDDVANFAHTFIETTTYMLTLTGEQFTALRRWPPAGFTYLDFFYICPNNCEPYTAHRVCKSCSWPSSIRHQILIWYNTATDIHADNVRFY